MNRKAFILALTVVLTSDAILLLRVAATRSAAPIQTVELTERELPMIPRDREDSSVNLRLAFPGFPAGPSGVRQRPGVFDEEKLQSLGFKCGTPDVKSPYYRTQQRRLLYVALDYGADVQESAPDKASGPGSEEVAAQASTRPAPGPQMPLKSSRLVVVDADRNFAQLRSRHPDSRKCLIVLGVVGASAVNDQDRATGTAMGSHWRGHVSEILPPGINVPLPYSREINRQAAEKGNLAHYWVTLHFGRSMEPWIGAITADR